MCPVCMTMQERHCHEVKEFWMGRVVTMPPRPHFYWDAKPHHGEKIFKRRTLVRPDEVPTLEHGNQKEASLNGIDAGAWEQGKR